MKKNHIYLLVSIIAIAALVLTGCSGVFQSSSSSNTQNASQPTGRLVVNITDAPASANVTEVWITIDSISVHKTLTGNATATATTVQQEQEQEEEQGKGKGNGQNKNKNENQNQTQSQVTSNSTQVDDEVGWIPVAIASGKTEVELLALRGGLEAVIASGNLTAGKYTQIRMEVSKVVVHFSEGDPQDAKLPSGKLKFIQPFEIVAGEDTHITFDIDAMKSVNVTGNGSVMFKPVIKLTVKEHQKSNALKINTSNLPDGKISTAYEAALKATGGTLPYTWTANTTLPTGLAFATTNGTNYIKGTPLVSGNFTFTLKVEDNSIPKQSATKEVTLEILP